MNTRVLLPLVLPCLLPAASYLVPQVADGGGWRTTVTVFNRVNRRVPVTITFYNDAGQHFILGIVGQGNLFQLTPDLGPYETRNYETNGLTSGTVVGWALIEAEEDIGGVAVFRQRIAGRAADFEAAVPFTLATSQVTSSFDQTLGYETGLALASINTGPLTITLTFRDESGETILERTQSLDTRQHASFAFGVRYPELAGKKGSVMLTGRTVNGLSGPFAALGLRFNPSGPFTTVPFIGSALR